MLSIDLLLEYSGLDEIFLLRSSLDLPLFFILDVLVFCPEFFELSEPSDFCFVDSSKIRHKLPFPIEIPGCLEFPLEGEIAGDFGLVDVPGVHVLKYILSRMG